MPSEVSDLIRRFGNMRHLFANIAQPVLEKVEAVAVAKRLAPEEEVARVSDPVDDLYLIVEGGLRVHSLSVEGRQLLVGILGPGDVFGIISVMDEKPSLHFASAIGMTQMVFLPAGVFRNLVYADRDLTENLVKFLCQRGRLSFAINDRFGLTVTPYKVARCLADISSEYEPGTEVVGEVRLGDLGLQP